MMTFNWLSLVTGVFYIILGIFIIIKLWFFVPLEQNVSYILGGLMILYGFFRIFRAIYRIKQSKNED